MLMDPKGNWMSYKSYGHIHHPMNLSLVCNRDLAFYLLRTIWTRIAYKYALDDEMDDMDSHGTWTRIAHTYSWESMAESDSDDAKD